MNSQYLKIDFRAAKKAGLDHENQFSILVFSGG